MDYDSRKLKIEYIEIISQIVQNKKSNKNDKKLLNSLLLLKKCMLQWKKKNVTSLLPNPDLILYIIQIPSAL